MRGPLASNSAALERRGFERLTRACMVSPRDTIVSLLYIYCKCEIGWAGGGAATLPPGFSRADGATYGQGCPQPTRACDFAPDLHPRSNPYPHACDRRTSRPRDRLDAPKCLDQRSLAV